jgi:hypothetical protein
MMEEETLSYGHSLVGFGKERQMVQKELNVECFQSFYGIGPKGSSALWNDFKAANLQAKFNEYFMALNWLKIYDTANVLEGQWGLHEDTICIHLKWYVLKIVSTKETKIKFDGFDGNEAFIASTDGTHCRIHQEPCTDPGSKWYSQKLNGGPGVSYELAVAIRSKRILWISGPHRASKHEEQLTLNGYAIILLSPCPMHLSKTAPIHCNRQVDSLSIYKVAQSNKSLNGRGRVLHSGIGHHDRCSFA